MPKLPKRQQINVKLSVFVILGGPAPQGPIFRAYFRAFRGGAKHNLHWCWQDNTLLFAQTCSAASAHGPEEPRAQKSPAYWWPSGPYSTPDH